MTQVSGSWLTNPATQLVCSALSGKGSLVLFVGGCVRNALLQEPVRDIDLATDATPETVMNLARSAGIKAIPTGIDHGTVTLVQDGLAHEITTFRRDVATDGRRAVVAFSTDVKDDAARRDFTMNALYADSGGTVIDPLNGLSDLRARRVRFIGNAADRIHEDYLRSLRYFRFHAWYGDQDAGFDAEALSAIAANLDGLAQLSRERVGAELLRLLGASDPAPSVAAMRQSGVMGQVLPGSDDRALAPLVHLEQNANVAPSSLRRLAALGGSDVAQTLRLSRSQSTYLDQVGVVVSNMQSAGELGFRLGADRAMDVILLRCALLEQPFDPGTKDNIHAGAAATFPVTAKDLIPDFQGADLGKRLQDLTALWIASHFTLTREALLSQPHDPAT